MYNKKGISRWVIAWLMVSATGSIQAHTISEPTPFHLSPDDYFEITVTGGVFAGVGDASVNFIPLGGGAATAAAPEDVVANTSVGVRVPGGLAVGQYDVQVLIGGTPNDPDDVTIWVRDRNFTFIKQSSAHMSTHPTADFKDADFGDVNNDGFLDIFESNSSAGSNIDRLLLNKVGTLLGVGGDPHPAGCAATRQFCDETAARFENTVAGVPANNRTYDADMVDIDLDGDLDIVRIDRGSSPVRLFINDGSGNFTDRSITRAGVGPALLPDFADMTAVTSNTPEVKVGDIDGDGHPDMLTCAWSGNQDMMLLNRLHTATGKFVLANDNPCNPADAAAHALCKVSSLVNRGCGLGHFNNDDMLDIILPAMGESASDGDRVLINIGNDASGVPQFDIHDDWVKASDGTTTASPTNGGDLKVADLDGDGDDDVMIAAPRGNEKRRILWNDNNTQLVELADSRYSPNGDTYDVDFADLDRDGDLDLLMTHEGGSDDPLMINKGGVNGNMLFQTVPSAELWYQLLPGDVVGATTASFALSVSFGDYDLDGDHDLLSGGGPTALWKSSLFDEPGEDRDWVFVLDRTRSMISGGRDFFEPSKNVIQAFLAQRRAGDEAGLVTYDYTGADTGNPNAADDANKAQIESQVGVKTMAQLSTDVGGLLIGSCTGFCTSIGWALKTGKEVAEAAPNPDREKVVVLLTDGRQNQSPHPDTIIPTLPSNVQLYTIALGTDTDDRMLSALATNGGKFYFAGRSDDYTSVQSALREIDNDVESNSTGKQVLFPIHGLLWAKNYIAVLQESPLLQRAQQRFKIAAPTRNFLSSAAITEIGVVNDNLSGKVDYFVVDPDDSQVRFTMSWRHPNPANTMIITDPKGRSYPVSGNDLVRQQRFDRVHMVEILDPLSGVWKVEQRFNPDSGPVKITGMASSDLRLGVKPEFPLFYIGEPLKLTANLAKAIPGINGQLRLVSPSKVETLVNAQSNGKSLTFASPALTEPGSYYAEVIVHGPVNRPFARRWTSAIHVAEPTDEEVDLRNAELSLSANTLTAGGSDSLTATVKLSQRNGNPLTGAKVSFVAVNGEFAGNAVENSPGVYSQTMQSGNFAGKGKVYARVDLTQLPNEAEFTVLPGTVDKGRTRMELLVGPLAMCTNERGSFGVRAYPVDVLGNPIKGADVEIMQAGGPAISWNGPTQPLQVGEVYERRFNAPRETGSYEFGATVNGITIDNTVSMDVFDPQSAEGRAIGCVDSKVPGKGGSEFAWWCWLLIIIAVLVILWLIVLFVKRKP